MSPVYQCDSEGEEGHARSPLQTPASIRSANGSYSTESSCETTPILRGGESQTREDCRRETVMALKEYLREIKPIVYVLVMIFGIASWVDINGVWVELPLMVNVLPEGWRLPSYLTIIIQVANVGPIAYTIANRCAPNKVTEWPVVYIIISVGAISCVLLVFFWDKTSYIGGELHSTGLLSLCAVLALVDCTSSVVFLPYMAMYKPHYMTAYYIGEGLSGLIPGVIGLGQGTSQEPNCVNTTMVNYTSNETYYVVIPDYPPPNFSIETFWWILFALICLSGIAFSIVHWLPYCKTERVLSSLSYEVTVLEDPILDGGEANSNLKELYAKHEGVETKTIYGSNSGFASTKQLQPKPNATNKMDMLTKRQKGYLLTMVALACVFTNGFLPAVQSYSCLPYGNLAYTLTVRLSSVANPLACFVALFAPPIGLAGVGVCAGLGTILSAYQIFLAAVSPTPPLQYETAGVVLVILTSVLLTAFLSYVKVAVAIILRDTGGHDALLWCGVVTQLGSFIGSIVSFICVNVANLFTSAPPCPV